MYFYRLLFIIPILVISPNIVGMEVKVDTQRTDSDRLWSLSGDLLTAYHNLPPVLPEDPTQEELDHALWANLNRKDMTPAEVENAKTLIARGASVNAVRGDKRLIESCSSEGCAFLIEQGAFFTLFDLCKVKILTPLIIEKAKALIDSGASVNEKRNNNEGLLESARSAKSPEVFLFFVELGADVHHVHKEYGKSGKAFKWFIECFEAKTKFSPIIIEGCKKLIDKEVTLFPPYCTNQSPEISEKWYPLKSAVMSRHPEVCRLFLRAMLLKPIQDEKAQDPAALAARSARIKTLFLCIQRRKDLAPLKSLLPQILVSRPETERDLLLVLLSAHYHGKTIPAGYLKILLQRLPITEQLTFALIRHMMDVARQETLVEELQVLLEPATLDELFLVI